MQVANGLVDVLAVEKRFNSSSLLVLLFSLVLLTASIGLKAYRLTLPFEGWTTTTDFESDEPILDKKLLDVPSALQTGDRIITVNGIAVLDAQTQAAVGKVTRLESYQAGKTVTYTVLRAGETLEVEVPLYPGTSLGFWRILKEFFSSNHVASPMLWVAIALVSFVYYKRPNNLTAQLLFLQIMATLASGISWAITPMGVADSLHPLTFYAAGFFTHWIHLTLEQPLSLHIILSFPTPSRVLQNRWCLPLLYGIPILILVLALTGNPLFSTMISPFLLVALYNLLGILLVVRMFFKRWEPAQSAQVRWFGLGYAFSNLGVLIFGLSVAGLIPTQVLAIAEALPYNLIFLACISVAILRYHLFDINIILNRTLVYGGLTAAVVGFYVLVVGGFSRYFHTQNNLTISLIATGMIAVIFNPARERLQRGVNRLLYGQRDEPYAVLSKLSERIVEPSALLPTLTETIAHMLKLPYAAIFLGQSGDMHIVASHGTHTSEGIALPLAYQGETVGELRLEPRAGETFKASELSLLTTIAQQASVAAYAVKQTLDLQRSREALVTAREEERLRIRRDLHDGLGPELASLTLKLDACRNLLRSQPDKAERYLLELKKQSQEALASIRRLVYALRPPALDELGLKGAIQEVISKYEPSLNTILLMTEQHVTLSAAVEVACYRIVQEALSNVARHAHATTCLIKLELAHDLQLTIEDNGQGLPEHYQAGVGLRSIRERAEELGGSLQVVSQQGTKLLVTLPLHTPSYGYKTSSLKVN